MPEGRADRPGRGRAGGATSTTGTIDTLEALDPESPAWNWAPQAKKAGFWHRRMAHETSVHRWDTQMALGRRPSRSRPSSPPTG